LLPALGFSLSLAYCVSFSSLSRSSRFFCQLFALLCAFLLSKSAKKSLQCSLFFFQNLLKNLFSVGFPPPPWGFCFLPSCWLLSNVVCTFFPRGVLAVTCSLSFSYLCISVFLWASCFVKCVFAFVCFFCVFFWWGACFSSWRVFLCVCVLVHFAATGF
jgi:hypothetical protein